MSPLHMFIEFSFRFERPSAVLHLTLQAYFWNVVVECVDQFA